LILGRVIGIDYGLKRVGIAVTDPLKIIAGGLTTVKNEEVMSFLQDYLSKNEVEEIAIGYPVNMNGTEIEMTQHVNRFIVLLNKKFPGVPVIKTDERLTSRMAFQTMLESGISKTKRRDKALVDKISATIILQSYLEKIKK
jgi:putative holliday junction resolvase